MEWWILVVEIEDILIWKVCDLLIMRICVVKVKMKLKNVVLISFFKMLKKFKENLVFIVSWRLIIEE